MSLKGKNILILIAEEFEEMELLYPKYRLMEEGAKVVIAGPKEKTVYLGKHGYPASSEISIDQVQVNDFQCLIIPGGYAPDKLRRIPKVLEVTQQFHKESKIIAFICHAGWVLISAKILKGVECTSFISIKEDMINAGANWVDEPVVVDGHFISSRHPTDLTLFCPAIINSLIR